MENIIDFADKIRFIQSQGSSLDTLSETLNDTLLSLAFADPSDIMFMARYFGLNKDQLLDPGITNKLKSIYSDYKKSDMPLFDFISSTGVKIGGRFSTDNNTFFNKFYVYLSLRNQEKNTENTLETIRNERTQLEYNESSDNIQ